MKTLPAHTIERSILQEKTEINREFVVDKRDELADRPDLLPKYASYAIEYAAGLLALGTGDDDAIAWLRRASRCYALAFLNVTHPGEACAIELDDETTLTVSEPSDPSRTSAADWIEAMWCALACGDPVAQYWLTTVDTDALRPAGVEFNDYVFPYAKFLRSLVQHDGSHAKWLTEAIEQCHPSSPALEPTQGWIDQFDYPALRSSYQLLAGNAAKFNEALQDLLQRHRSYWSASGNELAVLGLLSLRACALRRLAAAADIDVAVKSAYMPTAVWQAAPPALINACPYCIGPKPPDAPTCALCGRDTTQDAPEQLSTEQFRTQQTKDCKSCGFKLHELANTCPRCRRRQS
jgi:hypothetical protein